MFVRAYLRASTAEQDATRALAALERFATERGCEIASRYVENVSGTQARRPELGRLLDDARPGDVLLVESIDRLSRLPATEWKRLRGQIEAKGLRVVAVDLPTSYRAMSPTPGDTFTDRMLDAVNGMMLDMMAAIARKDYEQRRQRQAEGIAKAKAAGVYKGRAKNRQKRQRIADALAAGFSVRKAAALVGASPTTVLGVKKERVAGNA